MVSFSSKRNSLFFFEFFDSFLKISSFWNIICPMPWSKKGFVALFQYKIRRVLNTGFTDIHVQDDFRYLFGASGKISLPLAAIFCRVSATLHIHISTWISLCVPNTFLHVKRMRNLKQYIKSNFQNLQRTCQINAHFNCSFRINTIYCRPSVIVSNRLKMHFMLDKYWL